MGCFRPRSPATMRSSLYIGRRKAAMQDPKPPGSLPGGFFVSAGLRCGACLLSKGRDLDSFRCRIPAQARDDGFALAARPGSTNQLLEQQLLFGRQLKARHGASRQARALRTTRRVAGGQFERERSRGRHRWCITSRGSDRTANSGRLTLRLSSQRRGTRRPRPPWPTRFLMRPRERSSSSKASPRRGPYRRGAQRSARSLR